MLTFFFYTCLVLFVFVCLILILLILIQKGRGGGLASAFGGAGGNTAFGSKTGDVLTWATSIIFGIFLILAVVLNLISNEMDKQQQILAKGNPIVAPAETGLPSGAPEGLPGAGETPLLPPPSAETPVEEPDATPVPSPAPAPTAPPAGDGK
jgi:preprotein translocase subunit SecG